MLKGYHNKFNNMLYHNSAVLRRPRMPAKYNFCTIKVQQNGKCCSGRNDEYHHCMQLSESVPRGIHNVYNLFLWDPRLDAQRAQNSQANQTTEPKPREKWDPPPDLQTNCGVISLFSTDQPQAWQNCRCEPPAVASAWAVVFWGGRVCELHCQVLSGRKKTV